MIGIIASFAVLLLKNFFSVLLINDKKFWMQNLDLEKKEFRKMRIGFCKDDF